MYVFISMCMYACTTNASPEIHRDITYVCMYVCIYLQLLMTIHTWIYACKHAQHEYMFFVQKYCTQNLKITHSKES